MRSSRDMIPTRMQMATLPQEQKYGRWTLKLSITLQNKIFLVCARAASQAFISSDRDSITDCFHCFMNMPYWWRWMMPCLLPSLLLSPPPPPAPLSIALSPSFSLTLLSSVFLSHPGSWALVHPTTTPQYFCSPGSELISDRAMWQAEEWKATDERVSVRQPQQGHIAVGLPYSATLFSFLPPWFHPPFVSKSSLLTFLVLLALPSHFFSLWAIMIFAFVTPTSILTLTGCLHVESGQD